MFWEKEKTFSSRVLIRAMGYFLPLSIFLFICLAGFVYYYQNHHLKEIQKQGAKDLLRHKAECSHQIDWVIENTRWLATLTEKHLSKKELSPSDKSEIEAYFSSYGELHPYYDQIRYIDESGKEIVRVDFDKNGISIPIRQLQNKQERYYFRDSIGLKKGEIYISPLDLNIEHGQIERPFKPMIRFATPVYSFNQVRGIVILNFKAKVLLNTFEREKLLENEVTHNFLIDENEYVLYGPDPEYLWGFMFQERKDNLFGHLYPDVGNLIQSESSGYHKTAEGVFLWETIDPFSNIPWRNPELVNKKIKNSYIWKLVYYAPKSSMKSYACTELLFVYGVGIVFDIIFLFMSLHLSRLYLQRKDSLRLFTQEMTNRARAAEQAKSEFLATISHELRTPLNAILGFSDLLNDGLNEDQQDYLNSIQSAGNNLFKIVENMLDFSDIEKKQLKLDFNECAIEDVLNKLQIRFRNEIETKSIEFSVHKSTQVPELLYTDGIRLYQCLENLLDNAIKFTNNGHVYINLNLEQDESKEYVRFDIEDTGIGIPQEHQERIVQLFTQADGSDSRNYGGMGMGLALTKELVGQLHGKFSFVSHVDKGSVFTIMVPLDLKDTLNEMRETSTIRE